ncbi:MAG: hypothetical protein XD69_0144 [Clostridia bacterium 62_21]|nr:MAG: hypothetical protein XD69_0144 [Clostridia bacterium 62_21]
MRSGRKKGAMRSEKPAQEEIRYELGREIGMDFPRLKLLKVKETRNGKRGLSP